MRRVSAPAPELRHVEPAPGESAERFQLLFENMLEGFAYCRMVYDAEGEPVDWVYLAVNPAFERLTGLSGIVGKRVTEAIPRTREDHPELFRIYGRIARRGRPETFEIAFRPLDLHLRVSAFCAGQDSFIAVFEDITEEKRSQECLKENRALLQTIVDGTTDAVYVKDPAGRYMLFNAAAERVTGKRTAEVLGKDDSYLFPADEAATVMASDHEVMQSGRTATYEETVTDATGRLATFLSTKGPIYGAGGTLLGLFGVARDITDRAEAEAALRESETYLRVILDATADGILAVDLSGRILKTNPRFAELWNVPQPILDSGDDAALLDFVQDQLADPEAFLRRVRELYESDATVVDTVALKDGRVFERHSAATMEGTTVTGRVWSFSDISEQVHAREELQERTRARETLLGNLPGMAYRCANDPQWTMEFVSAGCVELTGYAADELIANRRVAYADLIAPEHRDAVWEGIESAIDHEDRWTITYPILTAAGSRKWVWERGVAVRDAEGGIVALEGLVTDISAQHEAEERLGTALAEWRETFDAMSDSVVLLDASGVVLRANAATCRLTGLEYGDMVGKRCFEVFHTGADFDPGCPHQRAARSHQLETSLLEQNGRWLRSTFQPMLDALGTFSGGVHVVSDVTDLEVARRQLLESVAQQQAITEGVISAIAATTEVRDPYTAGHQRRVGELATAIAAVLGYDADRLAGVRVAAMVHDVGKITVPAEVLSRPGRLSEVEFELIKAHSRASYDILSPISFPWPVPEIVLQHHERLDGSGYPQGLSGDDIISEARIIAVADVVEAMSSHRPYRAALGMDAALYEIRAGSGIKYDERVVAACLRLVEEGGFSFTT
jgi:PAS domain S-box-containing protein